MTDQRTNGAHAAPNTTPFMFAVMPNPALHSLLASHKMALTAARFWARRMHAYAEQMETLAECANPNDFARAQTRFLDKMREDYSAETKEMTALLANSAASQREAQS